MTTPSRKDDEQQDPKPDRAADLSVDSGDADSSNVQPGTADPALKDTRSGSWQDTPTNLQQTAEVLPDDLSPEERAQANTALGFLDDVRTAFRESQQLPQTIGRYSIVRSLGRGGFAEVFLAHDEELDRPVALKIPLFHADLNADARMRFEREARLAASLGHPQIVPVYEYGDVGPVRFIAFAWCGGPTLAEWMDQQGAPDFKIVARIIAHLADATQHAHQRGIVHRDLKPANVLVDESENLASEPIWKQVRITDFGLARQVHVQDTTLTREGQIIGTPAYMAPEQASGELDAGPAADIWALGMILFELLTGKTPFRRPDLLTTIRAISDEPVPRAQSLRREVPAGLDAIADLCLRKMPADRYETAHELAEDLRRWLNDEPVLAKPVSAFTKSLLWTRRNPLVASSLALAIASLSIGMGVALWQRNAAIANLRVAQTQTTRADNNLDTAQTLINDIINLEKKLRQHPNLAKERNALVKRAAELQMELVRDEELTAQVRYDTANTLRQLSLLLLQLEDYDASIQNARDVLALLDGLENELPKGVTHTQLFLTRFEQRLRMGSVLSLNGKPNEALELYRENETEVVPEEIDAFRKATLLAENQRAQSILYQMQGDNNGSIKVLQQALQHMADATPGDKPRNQWAYYLTQCRLLTSLINDQMAMEQFDDAEKNFTEAMQCVPKLKAIIPNHPALIETVGLLAWNGGNLYARMNQPQPAIEQYQICRELHLSLFEKNPAIVNPANIYILASLALARTHALSESVDESRQIVRETIEQSEKFPENLKSTQSFKDNMQALLSIGSDEGEVTEDQAADEPVVTEEAVEDGQAKPEAADTPQPDSPQPDSPQSVTGDQ